MRNLLLPRTDAGVLVQFVTVIALTMCAAVVLRRHHELRSFSTGIGLFTISLMAVRALH